MISLWPPAVLVIIITTMAITSHWVLGLIYALFGLGVLIVADRDRRGVQPLPLERSWELEK